ncbi:MAG: pesticin C-terminus-like muramidase, partial [Nitrospiraceae bacterium]
MAVTITKAQANTLTGAAEKLTLADLERAWDHSPLWNGGQIVHFTELPAGAQTALYDVAYQYGASNLPKPASQKGTPTFWKLMIEAAKTVTTASPNGDPAAWKAVWDELMNFGDAHVERRQSEASQVAPLTNGAQSKTIVAPPQSSTSESTSFMVAIDPSQQYVFGFSSNTSTSQTSNPLLATPTLRPSPDTQSYILALGAGSPAVSQLQLPYEGATYYQVDFRTSAGASLSLQTYQPGQAVSVPAGA